MSEKCPTCRAPVVHEGDRYQFDSSRYHMDAVKKLSEISALRGEVELQTTERGVMLKALRKIDDECLSLDDAEWEAREALKAVSGKQR